MLRKIDITVSPGVAYDELLLRRDISAKLNMDINRIGGIRIIRKSVDARQKNIKVNLSLLVQIDEKGIIKFPNPYLGIEYKKLKSDCPVAIIVGAGPAGLFAALQLIENGIRPIILERGKDVDSRRRDLALIGKEQKVNPDSNYCFGEGGAGTFSDGKLYTRSKKKGPVEKILAILYDFGADENILYESHPHIGTDKLPVIIKNIRNKILECGGEVHFNMKVTSLILKVQGDKRRVEGVETAAGNKFFGPVILATGHSARDVYRFLYETGIKLEAKGLAVGVRLEHPQQLIDSIQYHKADGRGKYLPAAEYSLLTRVGGRGVYSFCMCPGGIVVPSASAPGESVVNGMSASARGSRWANAAMVVEILPEDVGGDNPLKMIQFQENIESDFFKAAANTQKAPAQRMTDFVDGRESSSLPSSSYAPGLISCRVDSLLPESVSLRLKKAFREFGVKKKGFLTADATVIGAETRTSSPVRIPRNQVTLEHEDVENLYPVGEGGGWSGGIVSSAIDGERAAEALSLKLHR